ncbi:murein lipoprotein [Candidatus Blochmanniella camponoti]|uniref:Major outer membrane lipoprotein Lpp n=1 Tax=Candidatus Blochmanniella camponoti TaxID=108080 RepID=A0AAE9I825_9ENTR|nr:LPP leucine zipper domain-containing protein [Candidatus Blochmannia herculeanus]URJ24771.1 murein lipoprotein [Candidatus Blochmannia herculeanus]URJ27170.1 murein lipoprotein [Candidatus Blochmannia herculeanus]URJ27574.1 murein lipoprotein [Candidatus Blochmannia herculeanus]
MNRNRLICSAIILSSFVLVSCASTTKIKELSSEVHDLNERIDQISSDIDVLRPEIEKTKNEAARANQRIDNQITSYHK